MKPGVLGLRSGPTRSTVRTALPRFGAFVGVLPSSEATAAPTRRTGRSDPDADRRSGSDYRRTFVMRIRAASVRPPTLGLRFVYQNTNRLPVRPLGSTAGPGTDARRPDDGRSGPTLSAFSGVSAVNSSRRRVRWRASRPSASASTAAPRANSRPSATVRRVWSVDVGRGDRPRRQKGTRSGADRLPRSRGSELRSCPCNGSPRSGTAPGAPSSIADFVLYCR